MENYSHRIHFGNPYTFLNGKHDAGDETALTVFHALLANDSTKIETISHQGREFLFVLKDQTWESDYFGFPCFSIEYILFDDSEIKEIREVIKLFVKLYVTNGAYFNINVPSDDMVLVQALGNTGFELIETRLNYVLRIDPGIKTKEPPHIKRADLSDINPLRDVAKRMRNRYDRVHADPAFNDEVADEYLARFVEESIKGFADIVLKCDNESNVAHGFLAANYPGTIAGHSVSKLVLAAVDNTHHKGRLFELLHEMICILRESGAEYLTTITQASNVPAIRTWEKTGFSLFRVTHLYSLKADYGLQ